MNTHERSPSTYLDAVSDAHGVAKVTFQHDTNSAPERDGPSSSTVPSARIDSTSGSGPTETPRSFPSRVYSPSEVANWLRCPIFRGLKKNWEPIAVEWDPARLLGIAVQEGINVYLKNPHEVDDAIAEDLVTARITRGFEPQGKYTIEGLVKLALRGVEKVLEANLFDRQEILMVDEPLSQSRPDVVSRHESEGLGVTDFKVSRTVDERYRAKRLSEYETDDQFWHYAWEVAETLGEPVKWFRPVVIILSPKATVLTDKIWVKPERLAFWLQGTEQWWRDMTDEDQGRREVVARFPNCRGGKYGVCEFYDACHVLNRDPVRMANLYNKRERSSER